MATMIETVNPKLVEAEYAVRGAITERAAEIEKAVSSGKHNYSFDKVLYCNIGNPQQLNQRPISYPRQLVACCEYPEVRTSCFFLQLFSILRARPRPSRVGGARGARVTRCVHSVNPRLSVRPFGPLIHASHSCVVQAARSLLVRAARLLRCAVPLRRMSGCHVTPAYLSAWCR